jgi:hypothetical protein
MYTYLKQHPEIFMPKLKEPHFFGSDHHRINQPIFTAGWYLAHFRQAAGEKRVGEASTSYLHSKLAPVEIKEFAGSARIIIMLRNPVDMMYAYHSTTLHGGFEFIEDFQAALDAEEKRKQGLLWPNRPGIVECLFYRDLARYTQQVWRYLQVFGPENVHIIVYEDFKGDTAQVYRETLQFLDVNPDFAPDFRVVYSSRRLRSKRLQEFFLEPPQGICTLRKVLLTTNMRNSLFNALWRLNTVVEPRPPMAPELRNRLQSEFASEVQDLSDLLCRDLSYWCRS